MDKVSLAGAVVIVTGANAGIGKPTALGLAKKGARVIMACRNLEKSEPMRQEIVAETGNEQVVIKILDLASLKSIKAFADDFNATESRLDILVNNAGVFASERRTTEDGFEIHLGTNHLGHFYLTYLLIDKLVASAPSRVVTLSSNGHEYGAKLDLDDLQYTRSWNSIKAYARSKTANILFSTHLAKLLQGTGVTTYSLHPGVIKTELTREYKGSCFASCFLCVYKYCCCCLGGVIGQEEGAMTTLYCSLEPSIASHTGRYYTDCHEKSAKSYATNPVDAERLWNMSAELCHVSPEIRTKP